MTGDDIAAICEEVFPGHRAERQSVEDVDMFYAALAGHINTHGSLRPPRPTEKIARAAIRYRGEVWSTAPPGRHHTIIQCHSRMCGRPGILGIEDRGVTGFLTTQGRFVEREEAGVIAIEAGQTERLKWGAHLYSEDLW